jgi:hypothetical protein
MHTATGASTPPGFSFRPSVGGSTAAPGGPTSHHSEAGGATTGPSGPTAHPPPPSPKAAGGLTVASSGQIAHRTEDGGPRSTLRGLFIACFVDFRCAPHGAHNKWIFKHKFNSDRTLEQYKASPSGPASTTMRFSARLSSRSLPTRCFP